MCIVYMYNESKRCYLFGMEVRGMVVKAKNEQVIRLESSKCQYANSLIQCLNVMGEFKKK